MFVKAGRAMPSEHAIVGEIRDIEMTARIDRDLRRARYRAGGDEIIRVEHRLAQHRAGSRAEPGGSNRSHDAGCRYEHCNPDETDATSTADLIDHH